MLFVNTQICNGCGKCIEACPISAISMQHNLAFIDQDICQGCAACVDACPQGAILSGERLTAPPEIIRLPAVSAQIEPGEQVSLHSMVLPAISSLLLWTGRELVPRLANAALGYLDQRLQTSQSTIPRGGNNRIAGSPRGRACGQRRRRQRRNRHVCR